MPSELLHMLELMPQPGFVLQQGRRIRTMQVDRVAQRECYGMHAQSPCGDAGQKGAFFYPYGHLRSA